MKNKYHLAKTYANNVIKAVCPSRHTAFLSCYSRMQNYLNVGTHGSCNAVQIRVASIISQMLHSHSKVNAEMSCSFSDAIRQILLLEKYRLRTRRVPLCLAGVEGA